MAVRAELVVHHRGCVSETFHGATTLAQLSGDQRAERRSELFILHAATPAALEAALRACEDYVHSPPDVIDRQPTSIVFRGINSPAGTVAAIRASRCSILWPIVYRDGLEFYRVLSPSREDLRALRERLADFGEVRVRSVTEVGADDVDAVVSLSDLTAQLTRTQMDVLLLALRAGYYALPRRTSVASLARRRGVSVSTLSEHLRKAERSLLRKFGEWVEESEAVVRTAKKGKGRPRGHT